MKYILIAQLYWPVWLTLDGLGHSFDGIALGSAVVVAGWCIAWLMEFSK